MTIDKEHDYQLELFRVQSDLSSARMWQEKSPEEKLSFARIAAEREHAAELLAALKFNKKQEPVEDKIKRIIAKYGALARK